MKNILSLILIFIFILLISHVEAQETITVLVGQQSTIDVAGATDVYVGNSNIATVRIHSNQRQAIITGKSAGITSLIVVYESGKRSEKEVQVLTRLPEALIREIDGIFGDIEGVEFRKVGSKTIASGEILSYSDQKRLEQILELYPELLNLTTNKTEQPMIGIDVSIVEVTHTSLTDYNPQNPTTGLAVASDEFNTSGGEITSMTIKPHEQLTPLWFYGATTDIFSKLAYWITKGKARMMANPKFAVADGDSATFLSGGEIPFEYQTRDGMAVEWKEFGIKISVRPQLLASGSIYLQINALASSLDRTFVSKQMGIPAIIKRTIKNNATVKRKSTLVLAGIYQLQESESVKRVPILGYLLPFLFSSINKNYEVKEIMILVTPTAPANIEPSEFPMIEKELKNK